MEALQSNSLEVICLGRTGDVMDNEVSRDENMFIMGAEEEGESWLLP